MGKCPCCSKENLNRGAWTVSEDKILTDYIKAHGEGRWRILPTRAGLKRCGKSCRLRWLNYLRPDIKRGNISLDEEELIIRLHRLLGNRWSLIAGRLPGRTDNEIKNYWNSYLAKKVHGHSTHKHSSQSKEKKQHTVEETPRRPSQPSPPPKIQKLVEQLEIETNATKGPEVDAESMNNKKVESKSLDWLLPFTTGEDSSSDNCMVDLNMGEFCLSELLNSDFSKLGNLDNNNDPTPSFNHLLLFHDQMLEEDWTEGDYVHQSLLT